MRDGSPNQIVATAYRPPNLVSVVGDRAAYRFIEFFTAQIRNPHTRRAYVGAVGAFCAWLEAKGLPSITAVSSVHIAAYVEELGRSLSAPTVKQRLAAIRMMFDWLATGGILPFNPASAVRGPKHVVKRGKTPVLAPDEARQLLDAIDVAKRSLNKVRMADDHFSFIDIDTFAKTEIAEFSRGEKIIWASGFVDYQDIFGNEHETEFCFIINNVKIIQQCNSNNDVN